MNSRQRLARGNRPLSQETLAPRADRPLNLERMERTRHPKSGNYDHCFASAYACFLAVRGQPTPKWPDSFQRVRDFIGVEQPRAVAKQHNWADSVCQIPPPDLQRLLRKPVAHWPGGPQRFLFSRSVKSTPEEKCVLIRFFVLRSVEGSQLGSDAKEMRVRSNHDLTLLVFAINGFPSFDRSRPNFASGLRRSLENRKTGQRFVSPVKSRQQETPTRLPSVWLLGVRIHGSCLATIKPRTSWSKTGSFRRQSPLRN